MGEEVAPRRPTVSERLKAAEEALAAIADLHPVHRCEDGHVLASTPVPCLNDGLCGCGQPADRCCTRAILNTWEEFHAGR
jgi:hypothetical protein